MIRKISAALSFLLFVCVVVPMDSHFWGRILQPNPAFAQGVLVLEDFALYSNKELKLHNNGESRGNVGSNGSIDIKKGASGSVFGSLQAVGDLKNEAEIGIYGDVRARVIEDRGSMSVSGQKVERADLVPLTLPTLTFTSDGPDVVVPEKSSSEIAPGSYGRLKVKKAAAVSLSSGTYHFVKFVIDEFASVNLDVRNGAIHINVIEKIKFKKNVAMAIVGGNSDKVHYNYKGADKVKVGNRAVLRGILTAPAAKVEFKKGSRLEGAAYVDSIRLAKGASFRHYAASIDGRPPTADAGGYQTAIAGRLVEMDGSGSSDPDGDAITYHWSFVSFPDGSSLEISDPTDPRPTFTADRVGIYVIELHVDDGMYKSLGDTATVIVVAEVPEVADFVLYADNKIKMDEISGGVGHVGANRHIHIEKGPSGTIAGDLRVLGHIKNDGEITIAGNAIANSKIVDHGAFTVTGIKIENAALTPRTLPSFSFSAEGSDFKVPESASQILVPGSYGRVEVKKGAALQFNAGPYFLRELKTDDSAILTFDVSNGRIELNVVKKLEFGKDAELKITGANTRDVLINYAGKKEVEIEDRGVFRGTLLAPKATVEFETDSRLEGAVYARKIYLDKGVSFYYHENRPPVADSQTVSTLEDTPASITLGGSDPDGDALTFAVSSQPLAGTLAGTAPDLIYTPDENYSGTDEFSFTVNDGSVDAPAALVSITVTAVNDAPIAKPENLILDEDGSKALLLTAFDVEDGTLAYEIVRPPAHGTLSGAAPDLIYAPAEHFHGNDSFSFKASDGSLDSNIAAVSLTINSVNDAPTAHAGSDQHVFRGDAVNLDGGGSIDVDGDDLTYRWSLASVPAGSTAALSDPSMASPFIVPDIDGNYTVQLIVNDGIVDSAPDTVSITANPRIVVVPNLVGLIRADAGAALSQADLAAGSISTAYSDAMPADHVLSQAPAAGASIQEASAVDLVLSLGPESQLPTVSLNASPASIYQGEAVTLSWTTTHAAGVHIDNGIGTVDPNDATVVSPQHTTVYTITATGPEGSVSSRVAVEVQGDPDPQPQGSFGEPYEDLIPADATVDSYDPGRFALITGVIQDLSAAPLADVAISIHNHPEYGTVASDSEGRFSMPVEGGSTITIVYQKPGLITAHRKVYVPWNDIAIAETIQMIAEDPLSTTLTFDGNHNTVVTHQSTRVTDEFGSRSTTLVFTGDNRVY